MIVGTSVCIKIGTMTDATNKSTNDLCACGQPLHYTDQHLKETVVGFVEKFGACVEVTTPDGSWMVQRHFIALHGIKGENLPKLAKQYGFKKL